MHIEEIIGRFPNAKKIGEKSFQVKCKSHKDDKASLTITEEDNKILMHCHAGCSLNQILSSIGLQEKDLFNNVQEKPRVVAEYIYTDENNKPLYKVMRFEPKNFVQAKYDNGNWIFKMTGVNYVPYNLPNVIKSNIVYFVEGEKDANNLNSLGLVATTTAGGAASFKKRALEYVKWLKSKTVYIIPDNDKAGYKYAEDIKDALLKNATKDVKILKLNKILPELKEKQDISDVLKEYGPQDTLKILEKLQNDEVLNIEMNLSEESIFSVDLFEKLYEYEISDIENYFKLYSEIKEFCRQKRITGFDKNYKIFKESKQEPKNMDINRSIVFPEMNGLVYNTSKYELDSNGFIYEILPNIARILVCYHPIVPIEKYKNYEDGSEKIKIGFYKNNVWNYVIVDKSLISSNQSIIKLSDIGISVTSETAKFLVKYLAEIENLNKDKIPTSISVSRLGWVDDEVLMPYSDKYEFDNEKDMPNIKEKFGENGKLEDWIEFFKERRKYNNISRIIMAASVVSILLKRIKQSGFTLHIWGTSEYGKTVACMVGQSIFGNPSQNDNKGIGINFNFTVVGLEYRLNTYNNIPLFINEMQHQKDAKDYDKILFLISEGKGRTRSTKVGGLAKENSWNNVVITNGEKNIIKENSNAGAYNRCISCEVTNHTYENLSEVADFVKDNYGTPIREILKHINDFDYKKIYNSFIDSLKDDDTTNKQKILKALLLLGDKIIVDTLFKDNYYLTLSDLVDKTISKKDIAIEERAYELIKDWYVSEKRHFLTEDGDAIANQDIKVEIYGRELKYGYVAIIPTVLRKALQDNGFDFNEVVNAWKRKGYIKHEKNRNTLTVQVNNSKSKCIVLDIKKDILDNENNDEDDIILPF